MIAVKCIPPASSDFRAPYKSARSFPAHVGRTDILPRATPGRAVSTEPDYERYEPVAIVRVPLEPAADSPFMDA